MRDRCPCLNIISEVTNIIPPLVSIISDYMKTYAPAVLKEYSEIHRCIYIDSTGYRRQTAKFQYAQSNEIVIHQYINEIDLYNVRFEIKDVSRINKRYTAYLGYNFQIDESSIKKQISLYTLVHDKFGVRGRDILWEDQWDGTKSKFNDACDYLLCDMDEWLRTEPREMVCWHT